MTSTDKLIEPRPQFGDTVDNGWASPDNPNRTGIFVRTIRRTGKLNAGIHWELTDGKGKFWVSCASAGHKLTVTKAADALTAQQKRIDELEAAFIEERIENLWNAYNVGHEKDGKWFHQCMSDGEWLIRECKIEALPCGAFDATQIKSSIPIAARAAPQANTGKGE